LIFYGLLHGKDILLADIVDSIAGTADDTAAIGQPFRYHLNRFAGLQGVVLSLDIARSTQNTIYCYLNTRQLEILPFYNNLATVERSGLRQAMSSSTKQAADWSTPLSSAMSLR
jgi:hypothetical protein